jgi:hypothetical protein
MREARWLNRPPRCFDGLIRLRELAFAMRLSSALEAKSAGTHIWKN